MSGTRSFLTMIKPSDENIYLAMDISYDSHPSRMLPLLNEKYDKKPLVHELITQGCASAMDTDGTLIGIKHDEPHHEWDFWQDLIRNAMHADCAFVYHFDGETWNCMGIEDPYIKST